MIAVLVFIICCSAEKKKKRKYRFCVFFKFYFLGSGELYTRISVLGA